MALPVPAPSNNTNKITFFNEITQMMFGFGDSPNPHPETVRLVEVIVLQQLRTIVEEALKYSDDNISLNGQELLFLMRRSPSKIRRFVQYLKNRQLKAVVQGMNAKIIDVDANPLKCELMDFIEYIDETGEFTDLSIVDEVKHERQLRADRISQSLSTEKYIEFCAARNVSFRSKETVIRDKLRAWVDPTKKVKFSEPAMIVLGYMAHQTVAEIVDYVFLIREDASDTLVKTGGMLTVNERSYLSQPPISVSEVKEVMRRVYNPQGGRLHFGGRVPETQHMLAL